MKFYKSNLNINNRSTVAVPSDRTRLKGLKVGEDLSTTRDVMLNGERLVIAMIADGHTWQGRVAALQRNGRRRAP
jgi:hypothetical protein